MIIKGIECYGNMSPSATVEVKGEWEDGSELDELCADGFKDWPECVDRVLDWARNIHAVIYELETDE